MPYKERLKSGNSRKRKKAEYKVTNWSQYNQSLRKRGKISLYFPKGNIEFQFINDEPYERGLSGRLATYKHAYIEFIYILYRLFGWGLRQISGYVEDLWAIHGFKIPVPSFGHLSDLFATVPIRIRVFCRNIRKRIESGEEIDLIADSTGLRFGKASHWYETKYNKSCNNRPWKKLHISMDTAMNIHEAIITNNDIADIEVVDELIPDNLNVSSFIADGGYYSSQKVEQLYQAGITPVIPPPSNAVGDLKNPTSWHNKIVQYIKEKGTIYAFHKKYSYGRRDLAESQNSRIKRCIGNALLTQRVESQIREGRMIANIINLWNLFGQCNSVKIG
jgi:hypothetical protein